MAKNYRPTLNWCYHRYPGDFLSHIDDLWFWGFIDKEPFHSKHKDWYNFRIKSQRSKYPLSCKGIKRNFFGNDSGRKNYQYRKNMNFWIEFRKVLDIKRIMGEQYKGSIGGSEPPGLGSLPGSPTILWRIT